MPASTIGQVDVQGHDIGKMNPVSPIAVQLYVCARPLKKNRARTSRRTAKRGGSCFFVLGRQRAVKRSRNVHAAGERLVGHGRRRQSWKGRSHSVALLSARLPPSASTPPLDAFDVRQEREAVAAPAAAWCSIRCAMFIRQASLRSMGARGATQC